METIHSLIKSEEYQKVLPLIKKKMKEIKDLTKPDQEQLYNKLLHLRVLVNTMLEQSDPVILDIIRNEKYPSKQVYKIKGERTVTLIYRGSFSFECDAYVNTITEKNPFRSYSDLSAVSEFIKRVGIDSIKDQLKNYRLFIDTFDREEDFTVSTVPDGYLKKGDYITLHHEDLSAPQSYHILFYDSPLPDFNALKKGIISVLKDANKKGFQKISFFPLGFDYVVKADKEKKDQIALDISNKIAEIIVTFLLENPSYKSPEIYFNFLSVLTMHSFEKAFDIWTKYAEMPYRMIQQLQLREKNIVDNSYTKDPYFISLIRDLCRSLDDKSTILLLGETGVGKSFMAELIHQNSNRASFPIKKLNCAFFKKEHLNQQLFGWKKGSFTDARSDGIGAIEEAEGGTLFLDEIGYMELEVQRSLLKFIDESVYTRFGDSKERKVNVRIVLGTNVDLVQAIREGYFAHDLYERIAQVILNIPPLRKRVDDIPLHIDHFVNVLNRNFDNNNIKFSDDAVQLMMKFKWPGNVRQIKNYIEQLHNYCRHEKLSYINSELINKNPPRDYLYNSKSPIFFLESSLRQIMMNWDESNGDMSTKLINPILAKIYLDEYKGKKKKSSKIIGMDGTRSNNSLDSNYQEYSTLKEKFNLY